jgi:hypothetical protein
LNRLAVPLLAALTGGALLTLAGPARADDGPIVVAPGDNTGVVDTTVTARGRSGQDAGRVDTRATHSDSGVTCRYFQRFYEISVPGGRKVDLGGQVTTPMGTGRWWLRVCSDGSRDLVFLPVGVEVNAAAGVVTPSVLAVRAYNQLRLPVPAPVFNPARTTSVGPATTTHLATWWWVADWSTRRQRTAAGAVWAVVTAHPVSSTWEPGDGGPVVTCSGRPQPWSPAADRSGSACSSTYPSSSAAQPGRVFQASVTVTWQVDWVGAGGAAGSLPALTMTRVFPVAVMERESVVVSSGGGR